MKGSSLQKSVINPSSDKVDRIFQEQKCGNDNDCLLFEPFCGFQKTFLFIQTKVFIVMEENQLKTEC
jgi:hypothetical protein